MSPTVVLVGGGNLGSALLFGWCDSGLAADRLYLVEPVAALRQRAQALGVNTVAEISQLGPQIVPDAVVFAIKPQMVAQVVAAYAPLTARAVFLSVAAGIPLATFQRLLGDQARVVRTMPNTPAAVGRSLTTAHANRHVTEADRQCCQRLLEAIGQVIWVDREDLLDVATAVAGSGPAYVFLLAECLAEAAQQLGLPADMAATMARATVSGAGELLHTSPLDAGQLRRNVTSPGGTTEAALRVLMAEAGGLSPLLCEAVKAAHQRARQLGEEA